MMDPRHAGRDGAGRTVWGGAAGMGGERNSAVRRHWSSRCHCGPPGDGPEGIVGEYGLGVGCVARALALAQNVQQTT